MMEKEFEIKVILNAINSISNIERKKDNIIGGKKDFVDRDDALTLNNGEKLNKGDILILDQIIE